MVQKPEERQVRQGLREMNTKIGENIVAKMEQRRQQCIFTFLEVHTKGVFEPLEEMFVDTAKVLKNNHAETVIAWTKANRHRFLRRKITK